MVFVVIETVYGILADSLVLLADAGHNLSDVLSLVLAWGAFWLSQKPKTPRRTFGYRKVTIIASSVSAAILLLALGGIAWEALHRFNSPKAVDGLTVIIVAGIGVVVNTATALLFMSDQRHDLNIKGAFLHMVADAAVSFGVVIAGVVIIKTGWLVVDPIISMVIVVIIFIGTWSLLRDSFNLLIDAVPGHIDTEKVSGYIANIAHVIAFHDLHIWALSTTETALSVHLVVDYGIIENEFLEDIQKYLHDEFGIVHSTIQLETYAESKMYYDADCT